MTSPEPWSASRAAGIVAEHQHLEGATLPILHALQHAFGYVNEGAVPLIADALNLSRAEVHGCITFYHDFRRAPAGRHEVKLCRAEACQAVGSDRLHAEILGRLGCGWHETTADGRVTVDPVYCLGLCANGPAALVDGEPVAHLTADALDAALAEEPAMTASPLNDPATNDAALTGAPVTLYVPRDAVALGLGANRVARALFAGAERRGLDVTIVRTGSRGLFWLEPMVEVATPEGRIAYGPVTLADVDALLDAGLAEGGDHSLRLGDPEAIPFLARQQRLTFHRCGVIDPVSVDDYRAHGGYRGLETALRVGPEKTVEQVRDSGLRGRGGAGFPAGIKWNTVMLAQSEQKYVVCNADEGDSGTFADRMMMEGDPFNLIEGMTIAGVATGATRGYIYCRSEYPQAFETLREAIANGVAAGVLGDDVLGSGRSFHLEVRLGAGAYICGEETSLLESLEGRRGLVRAKPPIPALKGFLGKPTLVNNVMTFTAVPWIMDHGAKAYAEYGMGRSLGTLPIQLAGNIKHGGLIETAFGITIRQVIEDFGGGTRSGRPLRAVQVGGPLGAYFPDHLLDTPLDYEAMAAAKGLVGHGGVVVFDDSVDMARQARFAFEFCATESCGKCTPCRIGATRGVETMDKVIAGVRPEANLKLVADLCEVMTDGSLCAMGGLTPMPVMSAITNFPEDFRRAGDMPIAAE